VLFPGTYSGRGRIDFVIDTSLINANVVVVVALLFVGLTFHMVILFVLFWIIVIEWKGILESLRALTSVEPALRLIEELVTRFPVAALDINAIKVITALLPDFRSRKARTFREPVGVRHEAPGSREVQVQVPNSEVSKWALVVQSFTTNAVDASLGPWLDAVKLYVIGVPAIAVEDELTDICRSQLTDTPTDDSAKLFGVTNWWKLINILI